MAARWRWRRWIFVASTSIAVLAATTLAAVAAKPTPAELAVVQERIAAVQRRLDADQGERDRVRSDLAAAEREIGAQTFALHELAAALRVEAAELARVQAQVAARAQALRGQRAALMQQVRAAYMRDARADDAISLLLQQRDPAALARMWVYHQYYSRARGAYIRRLRGELAALQKLRAEAARRHAELARLRADQSHQHAQLRESQRRKTALLARLDRRIANARATLADLRADAARLSRLVVDVQRAVADIPFAPAGRSFARNRGRLQPPLRGRLRVAARDMRWKGVLLSAPVGGEVLAVHRGRVVFADWLRGFGLLLIVEHGDGYMTLYGHNQSLFKRVGDSAEPGEVIAVAGNTGGFPEPGLYFEIRHNGEAQNPLEWFARR